MTGHREGQWACKLDDFKGYRRNSIYKHLRNIHDGAATTLANLQKTQPQLDLTDFTGYSGSIWMLGTKPYREDDLLVSLRKSGPKARTMAVSNVQGVPVPTSFFGKLEALHKTLKEAARAIKELTGE